MRPENIQGVGFDLGETLIFYRDTPLSWASLYRTSLECVAKRCRAMPTAAEFTTAQEILARYNTRIVPRTREVPAEEILSLILSSWKLDTAVHLSAATEAFFGFFQQHMCAYPETVPVLTCLRDRGIRTGILTDVPYGMPRVFVQRDLDAAGISGLCEVMLTSVEVGVRKPETAGYLALATALGIAPQEMLYVGNEPKDVIGASCAGVIAVFLDRAGVGGSYGQGFTISTLSDLNKIIFDGHAAAP